MKFSKTTVTVTVIHPADESVGCKSLGEIGFEIDEGDWVGNSAVVETVVIADQQELEEELKAVGNDGTFFSMEDEVDTRKEPDASTP